MTDKDRTFDDAAKLLKISSYIGVFNVLGSTGCFLAVLILGGEAVGKGTFLFGVLAVIMVMYATLSWRANAIISAGNIPKVGYLTFLTVFNLVILGIPLALLGFFALWVGFGGLDEGVLIATVLLLCGFEVALFFTSHIMTLVCVKKIRRFNSALASKDPSI